ncbi:MAG: type 4a pilus biogenesis protein PilO, partial [Epsilonproteobacteria bacterium]|nr:type 4a pilus biogenesis protein PilO [Campylobacterota bacterium]
LLYTLFQPIASEYREREEKINRDLKNKITSAQNFLNSITINGDRDFYVKKYNKEIMQKKMELNSYRQKLAKLSGAMKELKEILYTKDNWSKFLHDIALKAKNNNLKLFSITNNEIEGNNTNFGKVLDIKVKAQGEYGNILSFINDVEQNELVTNLSVLKLEAAPQNPIADINFSVWGVRP